MKNLPHYILEIDDSDELGIVETSYVEYPATGLGVHLFSKEDEAIQPKLKTFSVEGFEQMTSGVLMMPDTKYLKRDAEGNLYTVEFKAETLKRALIKYIKEGFEDRVKLEHTVELWDKRFVAVEHWIIEDENTKSPIFGNTLEDLGYDAETIPVGTIMKTTYVADEDFWTNYIMSGKVNGYSLGGLFELKEVPSVEVEEFKAPEIKSLLDDLGVEGDNIVLTAECGTKLKFGATITNEGDNVTGEYSVQGQTFRVVEGVLVDKVKGEFSEEVPVTPTDTTPNAPVETTTPESNTDTPTTEEKPVEETTEANTDDSKPNETETVTETPENGEKDETTPTSDATSVDTSEEAVSQSQIKDLNAKLEAVLARLEEKDTLIEQLKADKEKAEESNNKLKNNLGKTKPFTKTNRFKPQIPTNNQPSEGKSIRVGNRTVKIK